MSAVAAVVQQPVLRPREEAEGESIFYATQHWKVHGPYNEGRAAESGEELGVHIEEWAEDRQQHYGEQG